MRSFARRRLIAITGLFLLGCGVFKVEYPSDKKEAGGGAASTGASASVGCGDVGCTMTAIGAEELASKVAELDKFNRAACEKIQQYALPASFDGMTRRIKKSNAVSDLSACAHALNNGFISRGAAGPGTEESCQALGKRMAKAGCLFDQEACVAEMAGFNQAGRDAVADCVVEVQKPLNYEEKPYPRCAAGGSKVDPKNPKLSPATHNHLVTQALPNLFSTCRLIAVAGTRDGIPPGPPGYWR
jgi:hypothetical protein